jgi:hypothetical protein
MFKPKELFEDVYTTEEIVFDSLEINEDFNNEMASLFLLVLF